jgi:conjugal transfer/entry exclusion protein
MVNNLWIVASHISTSEVLQLLLVYCENIRVYVYSLRNLKKLKHSIWSQLANISQEIHYMLKKNSESLRPA